MGLFEDAVEVWNQEMAQQATRPWNRRLASGDLGLAHYKGFLFETYHNAGLNPQLQAYATLFIDGRPRDAFKKFFQHAISELGHDLLAIEDLEALGVARTEVLSSEPLPETRAFFANTVYSIQSRGPASYLSYLFHLEYTPTQNGPAIMQMLKAKGVPEGALTFLHEHSTVDINHLKLMRTYLSEVVRTEDERKLFLGCLRECIVLHTRMLEAAFENGEKMFGADASVHAVGLNLQKSS
ncbi:MAG: iron-containing redox enzyme family protein [Bdellovibrionaceae bacterium]|nr:iron-containing redox enzyme family protein [Pseudobdellovibrionaceae bacterium]